MAEAVAVVEAVEVVRIAAAVAENLFADCWVSIEGGSPAVKVQVADRMAVVLNSDHTPRSTALQELALLVQANVLSTHIH